MALSPGTRLGVYKITAQIGEGGMGQVYRATDTKLKRQVAIKILPPSLAADADRLARFQREAEVLASLNHPHIAAIYGLEESGGMTALVMELVEGDDLSQRITRGAIPIDEALLIAKQIAEALEAAHEAGIIHRDLKPANIKVREDGTVKVLDFGLAKAMEPAAVSSPSMSMSPTITTPAMTQAGMILGTAAYMSPEQAKGKPVDKRADIWAFGCVLYEMLTGKRAFGGDDVSDTLAAILKEEPDWAALPAGLPWPVTVVLRRCLQKNVRARLRDIGDARWDLADAASGANTPGADPGSVPSGRPARQTLLAASMFGLVVGAIVGWAAGAALHTVANPARVVSRTSIALPAEAPFVVQFYPGACLALSPNGSRVVYCAGDQDRRLYLRGLNDLSVRPIPGTENGVQPFFSPDGEWIGFFTLDGSLKKVSLTGATPITLARELSYSSFVVGSWTHDERIVFDTWSDGLRMIRADGGPVETLTVPEAEWHQDPQALPGSATVLYTVLKDRSQHIEARPLDGSERTLIVENASHAKYLASGHLLFRRGETFMFVPFDASELKVTGSAVAVTLNAVVVDSVGAAAPSPQLAVSSNGTLVYALDPSPVRSRILVSVDRSGATSEVATLPLAHPDIQISPDGTRVAISSREGPAVRVQILDLRSKTLTRLADYPQDYPSTPVWAPDGRRIFFGTFGTHRGEIYAHDLELNVAAQRLLEQAGTYLGVCSVSRDGRWLAYSVISNSKNGLDIWVLDLQSPTGKEAARPFLATPANESAAMLSPDGKWIAYVSDESGSADVYVRRFPGGESKQRITSGVGTGTRPQWAPDGRELFFQTDSGDKMMVAPIRFGPEPSVSEIRSLFVGRFQGSGDMTQSFTVTPDGRRFLIVQEREKPGRASELIVVQNWLGELKRLVPTK